jgi:SAM-dependent methyltransferase
MNSKKRILDFKIENSRLIGLPDYYFEAFNNFSDKFDFSNANILELGGSSIPETFIFDILGAKSWTSVDIIGHASGNYQMMDKPEHYRCVGVLPISEFNQNSGSRYQIFDGPFENIPADHGRKFDAIVSVNSMEHMINLEKVIDQAYEVLYENGLLMSRFGPIWSSIKGSHFWVGDDLNFMKPGIVPPWAHLLMTEYELSYHLKRSSISEDIVNSIVHQHFHSTFINRYFFEDYVNIFNNSKFNLCEVEGLWDWNCPDLLKKQLLLKYGERNFTSIGIACFLYK